MSRNAASSAPAAQPAPKVSLAESLQALSPLVPLVAKFNDLYKVIEAGASIEQAIGEVQRAIVEVQGQSDVARAQLESVRAGIADVEAEARAKRLAAQTDADGIVAAAKEEAKAIREKGKADVAKFDRAIIERQTTKADLDAAIKATQGELDAITAKLEAAKAEAARILAG